MPLYEYQCVDCRGRCEIIRPVSCRDEVGPECPSCGSVVLERAPSIPHFQLSWKPVPHDRAKDIWAGTPLEDDDGVNPLYYESDKSQVDLGDRKPAPRRTSIPRGVEAAKELQEGRGF